jgi:hypothetical protein
MYPRNLGYAVSKLSGYHRNTFRIESTTAQTAGAGRVISCNLPENALIDLRSFRWVINDAVTSFLPAVAGVAGTSSSVSVKGILPQGNLLISRLEVLVNGVQITQGCTEYNTAFKMMKIARMNSTKNQSIDYALQNAACPAANGNYVSGTNFGNASTAIGKTGVVGQDIQMIISDWLGFLEAPSTRFIDTGLVGMITIRITLADNNVLMPCYVTSSTTSIDPMNAAAPGTGAYTSAGQPAAATTAAQSLTYTLNNFYFTIDAISINDGMYDALLRDKLAHQGFLSINFDEYYSFLQDSNTASALSVRFAVSSQSVNKIYATFRNTNYTSRPTAAVAADGSSYNSEPFFPPYFQFQSFANDNNLKWNFSINNVYHPQYLASEIEGLAQLVMCENKAGFDKDITGNLITSFPEYRNNKFIVGIRLNHPIDGETRNAFVSGFDSRGTNAQLLWQVQNINGLGGATYCAYILVNTTNTLRIGLGRAIEVIA